MTSPPKFAGHIDDETAWDLSRLHLSHINPPCPQANPMRRPSRQIALNGGGCFFTAYKRHCRGACSAGAKPLKRRTTRQTGFAVVVESCCTFGVERCGPCTGRTGPLLHHHGYVAVGEVPFIAIIRRATGTICDRSPSPKPKGACLPPTQRRASYLCTKNHGSSPNFILTSGSPSRRPH